ncbi:phosphatidylinositol-specific phospholipase C domain-containing protein [Nocardioides terrisoli]|uniref:phosphatidylinositol-specific phospholipase C domain-containing protein n=1 Tax=Nocardioides terrisoli TaxID=3388267 RepID=UPI00287BB0F3|nr:phosphatidylinositol-specific phospholipase C domain-containing protein [Nocardioides marmorisolisilvae]
MPLLRPRPAGPGIGQRVALSVVIAVFLGASSILTVPLPAASAHSDDYNTTYDHSSDVVVGDDSRADWMAGISDDFRLSDLSIPGTHDSGAYAIGGDAVQTQSKTIAEQLRAGIRAFDIRLGNDDICKGPTLWVMHGVVCQFATFDSVLSTISTYFKSHPNEAVVMLIGHEHGDMSHADFKAAVKADFDHFPGLRWTGATSNDVNPSLKEMRHHVVVLDNYSDDPGPITDIGIKNNSQVKAQNKWDQPDQMHLADKYFAIKTQFDTSSAGPANQIYANYLSAANGATPAFFASGQDAPANGSPPAPTPWIPANCSANPRCLPEYTVKDGWVYYRGLNSLAGAYLDGHPVNRAGLVFADFPGHGLIWKIIAINSRLTRFNPVAAPTYPAPNASGWYTSVPVTVTWNWSVDPTGGDTSATSKTCPSTSTALTYGDRLLSATCTDKEGKSTTATVALKIDTTAPDVKNVTVDRNWSSYSWYNQDVTVTYGWHDDLPNVPQSGLDPAACPATKTSSGVGDDVTVTATCKDLAGNANTKTYHFQIDKAAPSASPTYPAADYGSWYGSDTKVTWNWSDDLSGIDSTRCPASSTTTGEGSVEVSATCYDQAGNPTTKTASVHVDKTAPSSTPTHAVPNSFGWFRSDVAVSWFWRDYFSGIDTSHGCAASTTSSGEGSAVVVSDTCADHVGNSSTASTTFKVDKTKPTSAPTAPAANAAGWHNSDVKATWNWSDALSGLDTPRCPETATTSEEGADVGVTATCYDKAGNSLTRSMSFKVDKTKPTLSPTITPIPILRASSAVADPGASDALSGVATSSCDPVDTSTIGRHTIECRATDRAGNTATRTVNYIVELSIVRQAPEVTSIAGRGSRVVRFQLSDAAGPIPDDLANQLAKGCAATVTLGTGVPECPTYDAGSQTFRAIIRADGSYPSGSMVPLTVAVAAADTTIVASDTTQVRVR